MSLTASSPQPSLAWQFDGTTGPYLGSVSSTTQRGTINYTTPGKYISALNIQNPTGTTSNSINWNFGSQTYSIDAGFSFSLWIRFNDLSYLAVIQQFITFYNGTSNALRIQLNATQGLMQFQFTDSVSQKNTNMFTPSAGVWYHLALVGGNGNITVYLNGSTTYGPMAYVQSGIAFNNSSLGLATSSTIFPAANADFDDLRIFNTALSASQVQAIYLAQGMPSRGGVTAQSPQPRLAWQFESSNVEYLTGLSPSLSTTGTYAAPTGGNITTVGGQRIHTFTTVGTTSITFLVPVTAQVLVVGGGGGGGANNGSASAGGGGGAGEMFLSSYAINPGTYTVTVGNFGAGGVAPAGDGGDGGASVFGTTSANGGGGGSGGGSGNDGHPGGSGGGCGRTTGVGGASVKTAGGLGNKGGDNANLSNYSGAGGGGSAGAGTAASASGTTPVPGGGGTSSSISGAAVTYASGGTGGARSGTYTPGAGTNGRGDGGDGAPVGTGANVNGARGGTGIVIISYNAAIYPAPTYVTGKYGQAINFNNTLSPAGADPNCYVTYDVSGYGLTSNATSLSLWLNSGLTYPNTTGTPFYLNLQGASYNGIYTGSGSDLNINLRIGSRPITVGSSPGQTGVWTHHCAVFSNVGAGTSNTITYYYVNASLIGSANNTIQNFTTLNLGCQGTGSNGALCSIDDVRLYNAALTASQVQAVYAAQGMPNRFTLNMH